MNSKKITNMALTAIILISSPFAYTQTLEEVIVTAQIREQSLQDVPISVSAIDGEVIEDRSVDNLQSLSASIPNFMVVETQIDTSISIRGVRSGANKGFEQSVPMNFDGVTYPRSQLARTPLVDLERVEVLRGPQPTLFGKNAIGGAVSVTSAKPTEEFEGKFSTSFESEHDESQSLVVLSGPLSDDLLGRLTVSTREMDGWITNQRMKRVEPQRDETYIRGQLAWTDSNDIDYNLKVETADFDSVGYAMEALAPQDGYGLVFAGPIAVETNEDWVRSSGETFSQNTMDNFVFTSNIPLDNGGTLTSITSMVEYDSYEVLDVDYVALEILDGTNQTEKYEQTSQEIRYTSPGGEDLDYIVGAYFQSADVDVTDYVPLGSFLALAGPPVSMLVGTNWDRLYKQSSEMYSVFGQADINLEGNWRLTVGARYSNEDKDGSRNLTLDGTGTALAGSPMLNVLWAAVLNVGPHNIASSRSESSFDPMVRLSYDLSDNAQMYVSYTEGSKAGGFDIRGNSIPGTPLVSSAGGWEFEEEKATNIEWGYKMKSDRASFDFTYFTTEYEDLQTSVFDGVLGFKVGNASAAELDGFEMQGRYLIAEGLEFYGSLASLNYEFTDWKNSQCAYGEVATNGIYCDRSGASVILAPEDTANAGFAYETVLSNNWVLDANLNVDYSSEYFVTTNLDKNIKENGYSKVGLVLGLESSDGKWRLSLIGDNLTDERIKVVGGTIPLARVFVGLASGGALDGIAYDAIYARPKNIAIKLDYNF
jgi:outer membrane receptor protein involved in Fe transport